MPQLLPDGLPDRDSRSRFDFSDWADGRAWKFLRGEDYATSTATFRSNVKRWAKAHDYTVKTRPLPATDERGRPLAAAQAEPVGLAVCFTRGESAAKERGGDNAVKEIRRAA